jgi:hypothetical protein
VVVGPGVYTQLVALTHGGVAEDARLTIEAEQPDAATLDTAMRENACIHLESAPFVTVRNLRLLYFKKAGVYAYRSPHTRIERCTVFNGVGWETGYNTFCFYSPHSTVTRCLAVGAEIGFYFLKSPHATVTHNTYSQGMYAAAAYPFSLAGTRQMYNCFSFAGNDIYSGEIEHPEDLKTFRSDYNNLGTNVTEYNAAVEQRDPALWKLMKAEEFAAPKYPGHYIRTGSKSVIGIGRRFRTLKEWRESSGQDAHSIFADPKWVWPIPPIDSWDWRVKPDSPNIGLGEGGAPLGAFDVAK